MVNRPLKLTPVLHQDAWGKPFASSLVAKLGRADQKHKGERFSELWLGTHKNGMSLVEIGGEKRPLIDIVELPYILKILSIDTPLSIQAHPTKKLAEELHRKDPKLFPDSNHKPEMIYALTPASMLYGWRFERSQIAKLLTKNVSDLVETADSENHRKLFLQIRETYDTNDLGLKLLFAMNFRELKIGDTAFIQPGVVHAYLSGDLIECMASSDNVVRGGLTTKHCDLELLLSMTAEEQFPKNDFAMQILTNDIKYRTKCGEILFLVEGEAVLCEEKITEGDAFFIPVQTDVDLHIVSGKAVRAYVP